MGPRRRRSFSGESRASVEKPRTRRRTVDGETDPRKSAAQSQASTSASKGPGNELTLPSLASSNYATPADPFAIFDDLDEDTRVLQHKPNGATEDLVRHEHKPAQSTSSASAPITAETPVDPDTTLVGARPSLDVLDAIAAGQAAAAASAASASSAQPTPPAPATIPDAVRAPQPTVLGVGDSAPLSSGPSSGPASRLQSIRDEPTDAPPPSQPTSVWKPTFAPGERERAARDLEVDLAHAAVAARAPVAAASVSATRQTPRFETLPSLRVAVLATTTPGEVRLIALDARDEAPPGAAIAMLVPFSGGDGDAIARLFRGNEG